jgi:hypothetical protein
MTAVHHGHGPAWLAAPLGITLPGWGLAAACGVLAVASGNPVFTIGVPVALALGHVHHVLTA